MVVDWRGKETTGANTNSSSGLGRGRRRRCPCRCEPDATRRAVHFLAAGRVCARRLPSGQREWLCWGRASALMRWQSADCGRSLASAHTNSTSAGLCAGLVRRHRQALCAARTANATFAAPIRLLCSTRLANARQTPNLRTQFAVERRTFSRSHSRTNIRVRDSPSDQ